MNNYLFYGFLISFILTSFLFIVGIPILRNIKIRQNVRVDGPQSHLIKQGTPTMGGIIIILGLSISFILVGIIKLNLKVVDVLTFLFPAYIYLIIGFIDDYLIIIKKNNIGIKPKLKILFQIIGVIAYYILFLKNKNTIVNLYFTTIDLKYFYSLFVLLIFVSSTNAVNLTDGIDGLAGGLIVICLIGTTVLGLLKEKYDVALFSVITIGAVLSFLVYNVHPAKIFMGNSGSLMFGSILATIMILLEEELMIIIICFVFIVETISVIIQVLYFKITKGKRFFLMAPLHHHFEKLGYSEWKIDLLFWILGLMSLLLLMILII